MTITKMRFSISGEYITEFARQVWVEGDMDRAIRIMNDIIGMTDGDRMAVIQGKKKLVGNSNDGISLEDDNATECCGIKILSPEAAYAKQKAEIRKAKLEAKITREIQTNDGENIPSPWGLVFVPRSLLAKRASVTGWRYYIKPRDGEVGMDTWNRFERECQVLVDEAKERQEEQKRSDEFMRRVIEGDFVTTPHGIVSPSKMLDDFLAESNKESKTTPDKELTGLNGWIFPDGKFYSCGFMGHVRLADALGSTEIKLEQDCVKVQDSLEPKAIIPRTGDDFPHIPDRGVTQAQYDTMYDWCEKHGRELPSDLKIKD